MLDVDRAGIHGGNIVARGKVPDLIRSGSSRANISQASWQCRCQAAADEFTPRATVRKRRGNNLKNIDAEIPLGLFTCVTGVSGGGNRCWSTRSEVDRAQAQQRVDPAQ